MVHGGLAHGSWWFAPWSVVVYSVVSESLISSGELVDACMVKTGSSQQTRENVL